jgi:ribose transport system ATP-binding protein
VRIDPDSLVSELTVAQQQLVEIARALTKQARILIMDEPTAAISPREVEHLFVVLRELVAGGLAVLFISHRLDEVFAIADRITVMRDGLTIETRRTCEYSRSTLIEAMVGRSITDEFPRSSTTPGAVRLKVTDLSGGKVRNVSFTARSGEILGIGGLMGAGRSETARLIFGADPRSGGHIILDDRELAIESPLDAVRAGICLLTEDRKGQGLILGGSARDNFALSNLTSWSRFGWIDQKKENGRFAQRVGDLSIKLSGPEQRAQDLSGGNQQKLLVARWLETDSQVIIFDEPTRGIDVGAKHEMYLLINKLAAQGRVVIVISSELPELLGICHRILVMKEGRMTGEIVDVARARQEDIMALAV